MNKILECSIEYCINNKVDAWSGSHLVLYDYTFSDESDNLLIQFWEERKYSANSCSDRQDTDCKQHLNNEESSSLLFEVKINLKSCVVAKRSQNDFMKNSLSRELSNSLSGEFFFVSNENAIINLRGDCSEEFVQAILGKRCIEKSDHPHKCQLDNVFYVCSDIGEVDVDETEFLLAITPVDITIVSLQQNCITRLLPFTKIRTFAQVEYEPDTLILEMGRMNHGSRCYSFRSQRSRQILQAIKDQINIISAVIEKKRHFNLEKEYCIKNNDITTHHLPNLTLSPPKIPRREAGKLISLVGEYEQHTAFLPSITIDHSLSASEYEKYTSIPSPTAPDSFRDEYNDQCWGDRSSYSTTSDIYPDIEQSLDKSFLYERLDSEIRSKHQPPTSPEGACSNVIYQEVDIDMNPKTLISRRRYSKPTFISYVSGGCEALKSLKRERISNFESAGEYSKLFDPILLHQLSQESDKEESAYDNLTRGK